MVSRPIVVLAGAAGLLLVICLWPCGTRTTTSVSPPSTGLLGLGFSFHLLSIVWWGPVAATVAALWTWRGEAGLRGVPRASRGLPTSTQGPLDHVCRLRGPSRHAACAEHHSCAPHLRLRAHRHGRACTSAGNNPNGGSLLAYLIVVSFGVIYLLRRSNRTYGRIYGRLTDIETASARIERDLADPAVFSEIWPKTVSAWPTFWMKPAKRPGS